MIIQLIILKSTVYITADNTDLKLYDLRFYTYLGLDLTYKEIAILLDISVGNVEIKRQRFQKKMNLPLEKALLSVFQRFR